jgi:hypothetical protein
MKPAVVLAIALAGVCAAASPEWFDYDKSAPLAYKETLISSRDGVRIYDFGRLVLKRRKLRS